MAYYKNGRNEKTEENERMWFSDIKGRLCVFLNERNGNEFYSTSISRDIDGETRKVFFRVCFAKDCKKPTKKTNWLSLKNAFITINYYEGKNGTICEPMLMVCDYTE